MSKQKKPFSPSENHSYNVNVAIALGKPGKAVLLKEMYRSFKYFKEHNAKHLDGFYWFFLRMDAISNLYPEYTKTTMYRWIKELEENDLIASRSDLNSHKYDRTKWFTVNIAAYEFLCLGKTLNWLNSQNENGENKEHSLWKTAITKMRIGREQSGTDYSQNGLTIQPCLNPGEEPCLNPEVETGVSLVLFEDDVQSDSVSKGENVTGKEEKVSAQKEEKAKLIEDAVVLIGILNQFAGRSFPCDPDGRGHKNVDYVVSLLGKRLKGKLLYAFDDVELMIQFKCFEWVNNPKMSKHLKPITLFKRHGEEYIEEAREAKDNPAFLAAVNRAKEAEGKTNGQHNLSTAGEITHDVANRLQNW